MSNIAVQVTVSLDEFETCDLLTELMHRVGDHLGDPEPRYDMCMESLSEQDLNDLHVTLYKIERKWDEYKEKIMV